MGEIGSEWEGGAPEMHLRTCELRIGASFGPMQKAQFLWVSAHAVFFFLDLFSRNIYLVIVKTHVCIHVRLNHTIWNRIAHVM
jgi:hypothetical protein